MKRIHKLLLIVAVALALPFSAANADVSLAFTPNNFTNIDPNGSITVSLDLIITASEQITAVNYFLQELSAAGFYIISRDLTGSDLTDTYFSNTVVSTRPGADLDPLNDDDLGAGVDDQDIPATSLHVATFEIGLDNVAPGTYTINTFSIAGSGWSGPGPNFDENEFTNHATLSITVVPEPATWSLIALGGLGAFGMNLLRARRRV